MAISNEYGHLLLATGNKSEASVGYCTLYGDTCGGFAPIADVYKTDLYALAEWINSLNQEIIPSNILTKAPSAELREDQKDEDSLPPYPILDSVLKLHIEQKRSKTQIIEQGFVPDVVEKILNMHETSEYKREQSPRYPKVQDIYSVQVK